MLRTVMFWTGNPSEILLEDTSPTQKGSDKFSVLEEDIPPSHDLQTSPTRTEDDAKQEGLPPSHTMTTTLSSVTKLA